MEIDRPNCFFCHIIKCKIESKIGANNYAYCIVLEMFVLVCFDIPLNAGKHGGLQQITARLMLATLSVSYTGIRQSIKA